MRTHAELSADSGIAELSAASTNQSSWKDPYGDIQRFEAQRKRARRVLQIMAAIGLGAWTLNALVLRFGHL